MLTFPLKKQWYEKIKSGEKTIEYREVKPYWRSRFYNEIGFFPEQTQVMKPIPCKLRLGYTNTYLKACISFIEVVDGKNTDLAIDKPVYAIHLIDVRESEIKKMIMAIICYVFLGLFVVTATLLVLFFLLAIVVEMLEQAN